MTKKRSQPMVTGKAMIMQFGEFERARNKKPRKVKSVKQIQPEPIQYSGHGS